MSHHNNYASVLQSQEYMPANPVAVRTNARRLRCRALLKEAKAELEELRLYFSPGIGVATMRFWQIYACKSLMGLTVRMFKELKGSHELDSVNGMLETLLIPEITARLVWNDAESDPPAEQIPRTMGFRDGIAYTREALAVLRMCKGPMSLGECRKFARAGVLLLGAAHDTLSYLDGVEDVAADLLDLSDEARVACLEDVDSSD